MCRSVVTSTSAGMLSARTCTNIDAVKVALRREIFTAGVASLHLSGQRDVFSVWAEFCGVRDVDRAAVCEKFTVAVPTTCVTASDARACKVAEEVMRQAKARAMAAQAERKADREERAPQPQLEGEARRAAAFPRVGTVIGRLVTNVQNPLLYGKPFVHLTDKGLELVAGQHANRGRRAHSKRGSAAPAAPPKQPLPPLQKPPSPTRAARAAPKKENKKRKCPTRPSKAERNRQREQQAARRAMSDHKITKGECVEPYTGCESDCVTNAELGSFGANFGDGCRYYASKALNTPKKKYIIRDRRTTQSGRHQRPTTARPLDSYNSCWAKIRRYFNGSGWCWRAGWATSTFP